MVTFQQFKGAIGNRRGTNIWIHLAVVALILIVMLTGCSNRGHGEATSPNGAISISSTTTALGGTPDQQTLTFQVDLINSSNETVRVSTLEPVLHPELAKLVVAGDRQLSIGQTLAPHGAMSAEGKIVFASKGITKEQITSWDPLVSGYKVTFSQIIPVPAKPR